MHDEFVDFDVMKWLPASGKGTVFASLVVHQVTDSAYADDLPYNLSLVELAEGPLFPTRVVGCDPTEVKIGDPVRVVFVDVQETRLTIPLFAIDSEAESSDA